MGLLRPKRAACTAPQANLPPHTYKRRNWGTCLLRTRAGFHYAGARLRLGAGPACIQTGKISTFPGHSRDFLGLLMDTPTVDTLYSPPEDARPNHRRWLTPCARACSTLSTARTLSPDRAFIPFWCLLRHHALDISVRPRYHRGARRRSSTATYAGLDFLPHGDPQQDQSDGGRRHRSTCRRHPVRVGADGTVCRPLEQWRGPEAARMGGFSV